jgi:DNA invertase Pin-like site-specific DNA recombinase
LLTPHSLLSHLPLDKTSPVWLQSAGMSNNPTPIRKRRKRPKPLLVFTSSVPWRGREEGEPFMAGYVRVSTDLQSTQRQVDDLVHAGVAPADIWGDNGSGATMDREGWQDCRENLRPGDILVLHSLDRLSRDLVHTMTTLRELNDQGISVKVLTMDFDSRTPMGRFVFSMMAAFAQFEREVINERIAHGLQRARERGIKGGRKHLVTPDEAWAAWMGTEGDVFERLDEAARKLKVHAVTVKRRLADYRAAHPEVKLPSFDKRKPR